MRIMIISLILMMLNMMETVVMMMTTTTTTTKSIDGDDDDTDKCIIYSKLLQLMDVSSRKRKTDSEIMLLWHRDA